METLNLSPRLWNTGLVSSRASLTSWGEGASLSIFRMLPKRVCFASQYSRQWRKRWFIDSTSPPQKQMGFIMSLKPCLNLCSLRILEPRSNLINSFIPYGLQILKIPLGEGLVNSKIISLKILIFSEFFQCRIQKKFGDMGFSWGFSRFWKPR